MRKELKFVFKRETKGTAVYEETGNQQAVGTLYIRKHALPEPFPTEVKVTLEAE